MLASSGGLCPRLADGHLLPVPHMVFPLCLRFSGVSLCVQIAFSSKDTVRLD